ncbi:hypothetical protein IC582_017605 [Cucumis melo]|uniref:Uncharacterized protein LOC103484232 n=1 Tax=Cucumis melo TaxID=3656 RepID=A0A1S3AZD3_CUCME|nr:uncharacterized protein LOC103484232 [Cucumis melo]
MKLQYASDGIVPLSVVPSSRRYEFVEDVVVGVSRQLSAPNSGYSSPRLIGKKKVRDGLNRSKSCGDGRGKAAPHGLIENKIMAWEGGDKHKTEEGKGRRFKCGALCLLLPVLGFKVGKGRMKGKEEKKEEAEEGECISISISRRVSLQKFECGSWASSGMVVHEEGESGSLYFDLPMELIRNSVSAQSQSPVGAAFVFDGKEGVWNKPKLADESGAASPCIITPRLRKARQEFNALLEAHTIIL